MRKGFAPIIIICVITALLLISGLIVFGIKFNIIHTSPWEESPFPEWSNISASPKTIQLDETSDGSTVTTKPGAIINVKLNGGTWTKPVSSDNSILSTTDSSVSSDGGATGKFVVVKEGTATITADESCGKASPGYSVCNHIRLWKVTMVSSSPAPDPTASWETYTNQKLQFTIKYPKDWTIDESTSSPERGFYRIFYLSKGYSKSGGPIENSAAILALKNNNFSFDEVLTNLGYKIKKETEKKIKIGSNNFLFVKTLFQYAPESVIEDSYYGILHNDHWYIFGISVKNVSDQKKVEDILNNMLSTFKFTN